MIAILMLLCISAYSQSSDFYAYHTRLDFDDNNNTGKYADIVVNVNKQGQLVFSREYSYLPYWQTNKSKSFVERIIPFLGDGPAGRPDRINQCSYASIIENSDQQIIIHWRYAPDQHRINFTDFKKSYDGDIGKFFEDYVDEYFIVHPDGTVTRKVKKGCYSLDDWNDPLNATTQVLKLGSKGITHIRTVPARLQNLPGEKVLGVPIRKEHRNFLFASWNFDEGLSGNNEFTKETISGSDCTIGGVKSHWKTGVSGSCLSFDGYSNKVSLAAREVPLITGDFTIEAWIAPQEYSWNRSGIVDHDQDKQAGYTLGINHLGQIGLHACIDGEWQGLTTRESVDLLQWTCVTGVYEKSKGFSIYFDGILVDTFAASGLVCDAGDLDLYIGMAHEKNYPWAYERNVTRSFLSNMVFSGLIDEVRLFDRALNPTEIEQGYLAFKPGIQKPLQYWVLPAGTKKSNKFGADYTKLEFSPEWDGLWRVGDHADIVVSFDESPCRFVFWRGTNYLPSLVTEPGPQGIWISDQGPEIYTNQCFEHMSDKMCRYSHVRLIENTDARVVVHWRNASVDIAYNWLDTDEEGWGLWTDEYWYIYPDAISVRYQVSGRLTDYLEMNFETQQNEMLNQPGTRPEDNISYNAITISNLDGKTETWNYSLGKTFRKEPAGEVNTLMREMNLVYMNLNSDYKHFNIGEDGSHWRRLTQWQSMRLAPGYSKFNAWNHYPVGLLPSDGTVATGNDRTSSSCLGNLYGLEHSLDDGRTEAYNIYGMTNLPVSELKILNRSWNTAPQLMDISGGESSTYDKRQRAYVILKESDKLSFELNGSEESPILNPCFVIKNWGNKSLAHLDINGKKQAVDNSFRQGIIRDTDGTKTLVIWLRQQSYDKVSYRVY